MSDNSDLADLEHRLSAALERIGVALEGLARPQPEPGPQPETAPVAVADVAPEVAPPEAAPVFDTPAVPFAIVRPDAAPADPDELAALRQALEDERIVTAQLEERIRRLKARGSDGAAGLRAELADARTALARMDSDLHALRQANDDLRAASAELRDAAAAGLADAGLINGLLEAELAALMATRKADAAEAEAILTAMAPLLAIPPEADPNAAAQPEEV